MILKNNENNTFEKSLARLNEIVQQLEAGNIPLEETILLYEEGMKLSETCRTQLKVAQDRISNLTTDEKGEFVKNSGV
jgi:exodeoxyribonuclease VII small subunit